MQRSRAILTRLASHTVVQNAVLLYGVQIATYVFPLITLPILSRVLNPERFGMVAYAQAFIWYFVTLTEYGFNLTATRRIAVNKHDPEAVSETFNAVLWAKTMLTILGFVTMMAVVFAIPKLRGEAALFLISFLTVIGHLLFPMYLYQGLEKMRHVAFRDFGAKLIAAILIYLVINDQGDYLLAAAIQSGAGVVTGAISLIAVPWTFGVRFRVPDRRAVAQALRDGWPVFLSLAALILVTSTDIFVLGLVATEAEVGYYMGSFRLIAAGRALVGPVVTALYPHISRMAADSRENAIRFLRRYSLLLAAPFLAGSVILLVGAPLIVRLILGPKYEETVLILRIMAVSPFLFALAHGYTTYFMLAFGYEKAWSRMIIQVTVLNFILLGPALWLFKPAVGIAVLGIILDLFTVVSAYLFYRKHSGIQQPSVAPISEAR